MNKTIIQNHLIHRKWKYIDNNISYKGCCSRYRVFFTHTSIHYQRLNNKQWTTITQDNIENVEITNNRLIINKMMV
jgi:hypothetical protein